MRIKYKTTMAGPAGTANADTEKDVSDEEGQALVDAGVAEDVTPEPPEEEAAAAADGEHDGDESNDAADAETASTDGAPENAAGGPQRKKKEGLDAKAKKAAKKALKK